MLKNKSWHNANLDGFMNHFWTNYEEKKIKCNEEPVNSIRNTCASAAKNFFEWNIALANKKLK